MPDFTTEFRQQCRQIREGRTQTFPSSSTDETYITTIGHENFPSNCSCPGFQFRGNCKHVKEMLLKPPCQWDEENGKAQTPQQEMSGVCPECGGETEVVKVAV